MKNTIKLTSLMLSMAADLSLTGLAMAGLVIAGLALAACNNGTSPSNNDKKTAISIETAAELQGYLSSQPTNSKTDSYTVKMSIKNSSDFTSLIKTLNDNPDKYVYLDLSGSTITTIPANAFIGPPSSKTLTGITLPNGVTKIESRAFFGCSSLTSVTIPNSVTKIEDEAFENCSSLKAITIPNSVTSIGDNAFANSGLTSVTIGSGVTGIGFGVFSYCTSLKSIIIPNTVTSIGENAFNSSGLTSVTIPSSVTKIEDRAFGNCESLASVTFQGTISSSNFSNNDAFYGDDLRSKYLVVGGGQGTYTTTAPVKWNSVWTKQP
jgi:hypothetical protein